MTGEIALAIIQQMVLRERKESNTACTKNSIRQERTTRGSGRSTVDNDERRIPTNTMLLAPTTSAVLAEIAASLRQAARSKDVTSNGSRRTTTAKSDNHLGDFSSAHSTPAAVVAASNSKRKRPVSEISLSKEEKRHKTKYDMAAYGS